MDKTAFVVSLASAARTISARTGLSYELMLAQAVQETRWGADLIPGSNNLFGIKADASWTGPTVMGWTHEVINGARVRVLAPFRVYASYEASLEDRVRFLQNNPRYAALFAPGTLGDYAKEAAVLQSAGYATDPAYAAHLIAVVRGPTMQRALALVPTTPQPQPYYADPATHTQAELAALGLGPTGYRLGERVPSGASYSRWTKVDGNCILEMWDGAYFDASGSTLPAAKTLYFGGSWTEQITSLADSPPIKAARFERVRSGAHGGCEIRVEYESLRLCDAPPGRLKSLIGIEPVPGPARPHGSTYGYEYWFTSSSGDKTVLLLGTSESSCTSKFLLSAGGDRV